MFQMERRGLVFLHGIWSDEWDLTHAKFAMFAKLLNDGMILREE